MKQITKEDWKKIDEAVANPIYGITDHGTGAYTIRQGDMMLMTGVGGVLLFIDIMNDPATYDISKYPSVIDSEEALNEHLKENKSSENQQVKD